MKIKNILQIAITLSLVAWHVQAAETVRAFDEEDFLAAPPPIPADMKVEVDEGVEGRALKVIYTGHEAVSVPLFEVIRPQAVGRILVYEAKIRSQDTESPAYLELLCTLAGGKGPFFSRAVDQAVAGRTDWISAQAPFRFEEGQEPERVVLGLRLEGPGTVWVDDISLSFMTPMEAAGLSWPRLLIGPLLGLLGAVYGVLAGLLAPRGRGRKFLESFHLFIIGMSAVMLVWGAALWLRNKPWATWYPWTLCGIIGLAIFIPLWPVLRRRYMQAEMRRMQAVDLGRAK